MVARRLTGWSAKRIAKVIAAIRAMVASGSMGGSTALGELKEREGGDPFKILIGTILSHRTRDENTSKAVERLFLAYPSSKELSYAEEAHVQELIKPAGFYRVKAKRIIEVAKVITEKYGGSVPDTPEELLSLPSVGRKTANCVLVYAYSKPAIPVDTHVYRISNRLGLVRTKTPEETEQALMKVLAKEYWLDYNEIMVRFGQSICRPITPRCHICALNDECEAFRKGLVP